MLSLETRVQIGHQRYQDFIREADHERLINALPAAQPRHELVAQAITSWFGAQLRRFQAQASVQSCCTTALCC